MLNKKTRSSILILSLIIIILFACYVLRIDRFGLSQISWVDCVQINGKKYHSDFERKEIDYSLVGEQIGTVKFNVADNVHNANYNFRNGDATFLSVGTKIYKVNTLDLINSVVVKVDDKYFLYTYLEEDFVLIIDFDKYVTKKIDMHNKLSEVRFRMLNNTRFFRTVKIDGVVME